MLLSQHACATARRSPAWHRNARAKRARTRSRVHRARRRHIAPALCDLRALAAHHSRPSFRELMGKQGWAKKGAGRGWQQEHPWRSNNAGYGSSWQLWRGAWSPARKDESLRYDSINVDEQPALAITSSDTSGVSEFMRQVQRSLTTSQRCDTRIRKLQENKTKRQAQWQAYQLKMQSDFIKQKKQFHNDMAKIEQDILALNDQGQSAASHMQALVAGGTAAMEVEGPTAEDMGEWQALIHRAEEVPQGADFLRIAMEGAAQLRRSGPPPPPALAQVQTGLSMMPPRLMESMVGCPPGMPPIAQAPPEQLVPPPQGHLKAQLGQAVPPHPAGDAGTMIGQQAQTGPPPGSGELDPVQIQAYAAADVANARPGPYSRSPTAASPLGEAKTLPAHQMQASGQQDGPQLPTTAPPQREVCQRQFVKNKHIQPVHPAHPGGVDLATKLAAKRAAAPFGGQQQQQNGLPQQPLPSHQVPVPAEDAQAAAPTAGPQLIDDDGEVPSPHFHDMG